MSNLLDSLAGEGALAARGEFRLDQNKAREKMEQFQLVDPYLYVMELVQGAHLLGAKQIEFKIDSDELEMQFDGDGFSVEELEDIYSAAFSREPDDRVQARRHFAIALTAIGALGPSEVRVTMPADGGDSAQLLIEGDQDDVVSTVPTTAFAARNRVYVREKFRFGHLVDFFDLSDDNHREVQLIRQRCQYASISIKVNNQQVAHGHRLSPEAKHQVEVTWQGDKGLLGLRTTGVHTTDATSDIRLVQNGVWITSVALDAAYVGIEAVFETSRLTKNISQSAFVENDTFRTLINGVLREAMHESMVLWLADLKVTSTNYGALRGIAASLWRYVVNAKSTASPAANRVAKDFERLPLWPSACAVANGPDVFTFGAVQMVTLRSLIEGPPNSPILYADRRYHNVSNERPVFLRRSDTQAFVDTITDYTRRSWKSANQALSALEERERNKQRWALRHWTEPGRALHPHKFVFHKEGFEIELFCAIDRTTDVVLVHVHDGRVLNSGRIPEQLPAAMVVIKGDFKVNDTWDAPMRTAALERVYRSIVEWLPQVWQAVAGDERLMRQENQRQLVGVAALQLVTGTYVNFGLKAFGFTDGISNAAIDMMKSEESPDAIRIGARSGEGAQAAPARIDALGTIALAEVIPTHSSTRSIRDVVHAARNTVWTADLQQLRHYTTVLNSWNDGFIVSEDYPWGYLLDSVFGDTTDAIVHIKRDLARQDFLRQEQYDYARGFELPRYAVTGTFQGKGFKVTWGARAAAGSRGTMRFVFEQRTLERVPTDDRIAIHDVVVEGSAIKPNDGYTGAAQVDFLPLINDGVADDMAAAIIKLCEQLHDADGEGVTPQQVDFVWEVMERALEHDDALADTPFARDTEGRVYSANQLVRMSREGKIYWVEEGRDVLLQIVPPGQPAIEVPARTVLPQLHTMVGGARNLVDATASVARTHLVTQFRREFYSRPQRVFDINYAIMTETLPVGTGHTMAGLLAAEPAGQQESLLVVCRELREVLRRPVVLPFGRFEVVHNDDRLLLDESWDQPLESITNIELSAFDAAEKLAVAYLAAHRNKPSNAVRERVIKWAITAVDNEKTTRQTWPNAYNALINFPLLRRMDSGLTSVHEMRDLHGTIHYIHQNQAATGLPPGCFKVSELELTLLRRIFGARAVLATRALGKAITGESTVAEPQKHSPKQVKVWEIDAADAAGSPADSDDARPLDPVDEVVSQTPAQALIDELRGLIHGISSGSHRSLHSKYTEEMQLWGNDPKRVARVTSGKVSVMKDHALTRYALEDVQDPIRRAFLASGVLTVINHHYEEVDENDETALQLALMQTLLDRGQS